MNLRDRLFLEARKYRDGSHSPYSKYKVGAAVLMENGQIYGGSNIENASYGATVCAERVAIWKGISEGISKIEEILVLTDQENPWPPCGMCLQVISEFATEKTQVSIANDNQVVETKPFSFFFPQSFNPSHL